MARQHKGEVMIAGEQLRYEREREEHDALMVRFLFSEKFKFKG